MDILALTNAPWANAVAGLAILYGLVFVWRGLSGGRDGRRGLLRRRIEMLDRMEGFRLTSSAWC